MFHTLILMAGKLFLSIKMFLPLNLAATFLPTLSDPGRIQTLRREVSLTSANILNLNTIPITILPAPGVGYFISPKRVTIKFTGGTVAYTNGSSAVTKFVLGTSTTAVQLVGGSEAIWLVTIAPNKRIQVIPWAGTTDTAANPPLEDNGALTLQAGTANLVAGNGTAEIVVEYSIEPTS